METNWVLNEAEHISSGQRMMLYLLLDLCGIDLCMGLCPEHRDGYPEFYPPARCERIGSHITISLKGFNRGDLEHCKRISYDELVEMLKEEIKSKCQTETSHEGETI